MSQIEISSFTTAPKTTFYDKALMAANLHFAGL